MDNPETFEGMAASAFNQIRQNAHSSVAVPRRLLETIAVLGPCAQREAERDVLRRQAIMIERQSRKIPEEWDRADIQERYAAALKALDAEAAAPRAFPRGASLS